MTNTVVSICSKSHSDVWRLTSELLPINLTADTYIVYVPEKEVQFFESITNSKIQVMSQEQLGLEFGTELKRRLENSKNSDRFGWYLQQFYKIKAIQLASSEIVTIWDADCVPVAPIETKNDLGQLVYINSSKEFHTPYFENIRRLLEMDRVQEICFVIPGFPMKTEWVGELIMHIESLHGKNWFDAIMQTTDFSLMSGFSETETLGTWVANRYPGQWISRNGTWERFGQSRFGYAKRQDVDHLLSLGKVHNLEIITFENWDVRGFRRIGRAVAKLIQRLTRKW
jgi:hypothetical protein